MRYVREQPANANGRKDELVDSFRLTGMALRACAALLLLLTPAAANVTCICNRRPCSSALGGICTATSMCFTHYLQSTITQTSVYDDQEEEEVEEPFIIRGCATPADLFRCDNTGPVREARLPHFYCCQNDFCNNADVVFDNADDYEVLFERENENESGKRRDKTRKGKERKTQDARRLTTVRKGPRPSPTTKTVRNNNKWHSSHAMHAKSTSTPHGQPSNAWHLHPVYIVLLVSTGTVLVLVVTFAIVVVKRFRCAESRYRTKTIIAS